MLNDFKSFVFVSVDDKGVADAFFVSVDVKGVSGKRDSSRHVGTRIKRSRQTKNGTGVDGVRRHWHIRGAHGHFTGSILPHWYLKVKEFL